MYYTCVYYFIYVKNMLLVKVCLGVDETRLRYIIVHTSKKKAIVKMYLNTDQ